MLETISLFEDLTETGKDIISATLKYIQPRNFCGAKFMHGRDANQCLESNQLTDFGYRIMTHTIEIQGCYYTA